MAKLTTQTIKKYTIELSEEEFNFLCSMLQNPWGENEPFDTRDMRRTLWEAFHPPMAAVDE